MYPLVVARVRRGVRTRERRKVLYDLGDAGDLKGSPCGCRFPRGGDCAGLSFPFSCRIKICPDEGSDLDLVPMEVQPSDDVEKYAGSDIISRAETRDGRGSGLASAGEVWVDDGNGDRPCRVMEVEMTMRLTVR